VANELINLKKEKRGIIHLQTDSKSIYIGRTSIYIGHVSGSQRALPQLEMRALSMLTPVGYHLVQRSTAGRFCKMTVFHLFSFFPGLSSRYDHFDVDR
jgi:hypothetical protein